MLKAVGIVILIVLVFLILVIVCNTKYKIGAILRKNIFKYNFKVKLFLGIISIIGVGDKKKIELFIKIFFVKKRIHMNSKQNKNLESNNTRSKGNILKQIEKIYGYKKFIKKIILIIRPEYVKIEGRYGLKDPYTTGMLGGLFTIIKAIVPKKSINMKPDFFNEVFNMSVAVKGRFKIVSLIFIAFKFFMANHVKIKFHKIYRRKSWKYEKSSRVKAG